MSPLRIAQWVGVVVLLLVAGYLVRTCGRPTPVDAVTDRAKVLLAEVDSLKADNAQRVQRESTLYHRALQSQAQAATATLRSKALADQLTRATNAADSIRLQDSVITAQRWVILTTEARCSALDSAYAGCRERAQLLQIRLDTLQSALRRQVGVATCKVLVVRCPTRLQAAGFGLLVGAVGAWALKP